MEPLQAPINATVLIVMFTTWIFYIIQIIFILTFTLVDLDYYKKKSLLFDLALFIDSCAICSCLTFSVARNGKLFYTTCIILSIVFDIIIFLSIYSLSKKEDIVFIIIKVIELFPGIVFYIFPKLINGNNNLVNNNNQVNNNQVNNNNNNLNGNFIQQPIFV